MKRNSLAALLVPAAVLLTGCPTPDGSAGGGILVLGVSASGTIDDDDRMVNSFAGDPAYAGDEYTLDIGHDPFIILASAEAPFSDQVDLDLVIEALPPLPGAPPIGVDRPGTGSECLMVPERNPQTPTGAWTLRVLAYRETPDAPIGEHHYNVRAELGTSCPP